MVYNARILSISRVVKADWIRSMPLFCNHQPCSIGLSERGAFLHKNYPNEIYQTNSDTAIVLKHPHRTISFYELAECFFFP